MILTNKLKMDLLRPGVTPILTAVQTDSNTRKLEIKLYADKKPFVLPAGGRVVIRFEKIDGKGGEYDTLSDGSPAWTMLGNVLTVTLVADIFSFPGSVMLTVTFLAEGMQISTPPIHLNVEPVHNAQAASSKNYFYVLAPLPAPDTAKPDQFIQVAQVNQDGKVTAVRAVPAEGLSGGQIHPDTIKDCVDAYLSQNPPVMEEADPTVPEWAKQPQKPAYTAAEIGAQPAGNYLTEHQDISGKLDADKLPEAVNAALAYAKESGEFDGEKGDSGVYILSAGETLADAPKDAGVVIDPNGEGVEIPEGGGTSAQADWNAEEGQPGHILNRPFGSTVGKGFILEETTPAFYEDMGGFVLTKAVPLTAGREYTVNWNGTEYVCVSEDYNDDLDGDGEVENAGQMLGNTSIVGGTQENDCPFAILLLYEVTEAGIGGLIVPLDGSTSLTLSISGEVEIITPIPKKYLSEVRGQKQIIIDCNKETVNIPFETAWEMDIAELQGAMTVIGDGYMSTAISISKREEIIQGVNYKAIYILFRDSILGTRIPVVMREVIWSAIDGTEEFSVPSHSYQSAHIDAYENDNSFVKVYGGLLKTVDMASYTMTLGSLVLESGGKRFEINVDDSGNLTATPV